MPITKLALQRRHMVELDIIKQYVDKYTRLWDTMRESIKIAEIVPFVETKLWNCFSVKCNYVDDVLIGILEGQGYHISEIKWLGYDHGFDIRVLKIDDTADTKRLEICLNSAQETERIEKLIQDNKR